MANLYSTLPSIDAVLAATSQVPDRTTAPIETGVVGVHDVYASFNPAIRNDMAQIGTKWARTALNWSEVQKGGLGNYNYDWSNYDAVFADYKAKGIKPLVTISSLPGTADSNWADIDRDFQLFFKAAVDRYKGMGVHYWEIFNEPNLPGYGWPGNGQWPEGRPEDYFGAYVMLLARSAKILRENDPQGVNLIGGFSPDGFNPFTEGLYSKYNAQKAFDIMAYHPYGLEGHWSDGIDSIVNSMAAGSDNPNKPIWFTEYGTQDDANRAAIVQNVLNEYAANSHKVGGFFLLGMRDSPAGRWGLMTADGTHKAAWDVYKAFEDQWPDSGPAGETADLALSLSSHFVNEISAAGTLVGALSLGDDAGATYTLVNDGGGRFTLNGNHVAVKNGVMLDYEQRNSHDIVVQATSSAGQVATKTFTIGLRDVGNEVNTGTSGADVVAGGATNDQFWLKGGNDVMTGGLGQDAFVFDTTPNASTNRDQINDFTPADDTIYLDNAVYTRAGTEGRAIASSAFWTGSAAHDSTDRVIYNKATGALLYDPDGTGSAQAVQFAVVKAGLSITASDFVVI